MEIIRQITVNAPFETVWRILFEEFADVGTWTTAVRQSKPNPNTSVINGQELEGRICETPFGRTIENFTMYDEKSHKFTYEVEDGMPAMITKAKNTWQATPRGNQTVVDMHLVMETNRFPGKLMEPLLKRQMVGFMNNVLEELQHYAETGRLHPRVLKAKQAA